MKIEVTVDIMEIGGLATIIPVPQLLFVNDWNRKSLVLITTPPPDVRTYTVDCEEIRRALDAVQKAKP